MNYGITLLSAIPVRKEPDERSEMVTQLLFGESFEVVERKQKWLFIENLTDAYRGWIDQKMAQEISKEEQDKIEKACHFSITKHVETVVKNENDVFLRLGTGSRLPLSDINGKIFKLAGKRFEVVSDFDIRTYTLGEMLLLATNLLGTPYLWGGKTPYGIDCSGFTQILYSTTGTRLLRDANQQAEQGQPVRSLQEVTAGDMAFFGDDKITHVGILLTQNSIIHASGSVRVDRIDESGIFHAEDRKYTHFLKKIRRMVV